MADNTPTQGSGTPTNDEESVVEPQASAASQYSRATLEMVIARKLLIEAVALCKRDPAKYRPSVVKALTNFFAYVKTDEGEE